MNQDIHQPSTFLTPLAILLGSMIIAGSILTSGSRTDAPRVAAVADQGQTAGAADSAKVSTEGSPYIGRADAPLTIAYWYDYQCPFCRISEETVMQSLIGEYVTTGKVKVLFKDMQFLGPDSQKLGRISRAVWETAPAKFYDWHKAIFEAQGEENSSWASDESVSAIASRVFGQSQAAEILALAERDSARYQGMIDADKREAGAFGVNSTPSFLIGGTMLVGAKPYEEMRAAIEAEL